MTFRVGQNTFIDTNSWCVLGNNKFVTYWTKKRLYVNQNNSILNTIFRYHQRIYILHISLYMYTIREYHWFHQSIIYDTFHFINMQYPEKHYGNDLVKF